MMRARIRGAAALAGLAVTGLLAAGCATSTTPDGGRFEVANTGYANYCVSERSTRSNIWWCYLMEPVPEGQRCACPATPYRPGFRDGLTIYSRTRPGG